MKTIAKLSAACALASVAVFAEPVVPGEFTDPTNMKKALESIPVTWRIPPENLQFPYISTYYITPTVMTSEKVVIPFFVTDFYHSKVRFGDDSFRFSVHFKCIKPDGALFREETLKDVPSGDGAFEFAPFPEGEYEFCVWAVDAKGRESHRVWHMFRVMTPEALAIPARETYVMTTEDLAAYSIRNDGDLGRRVLVDAPTLDGYEPKTTPRDGDPGYTVFIPAPEGKIPAGARLRTRIVYDDGYDTNAVEQAAIATAEGLQKLLEDKAAAGFRKVILLPGTYRVSAFRKIKLPDRMTLDLNGATLKENAFTGCGALIVSISNVTDAHLVNGTLEGDYYEHDYANSEKNSEWPTGFGISGNARYCSVENVLVRDITGYGGGNGMGKLNDSLTSFHKGIGGFSPGWLDIRDGSVDAKAPECFVSDFVKIPDGIDRLQVSAYLGYQGIRTHQWQVAGCWYDKDRKFVFGEVLWQYRVVRVPPGAVYLRISEANGSAKAAGKDDMCATRFYIPQNCAVRNCTFDRCRCVGYAASAMKNMLFENNFFTHSGEAAAKCAFDAEDGWDMMQDVTFRGNRCEANPFNNRLLTCAGHNFIFEKNKCGVYLWPRTNSPCVRDNEMDTATFMCDSRNRSGYGRFERNTYTGAVNMPSSYRSYLGWDFSLAGIDIDGAGRDLTMSFGPTARIRGGRFAAVRLKAPSLVFGTAFRNCNIVAPVYGRWFGAVTTGGSLDEPAGTNIFTKCTFSDVEITRIKRGGFQDFEGCTFENCRFEGVDRADVVFSNCVFKTCSFKSREKDDDASRIMFSGCTFETKGTSLASLSAGAVGDLTFDNCTITDVGGKCDAVLDFFSLEPRGTDRNVVGEIGFFGCTFGPGIKTLAAISADWKGASQDKKIHFTVKGNKFTEKGVTPIRKPLPLWSLTRVRKNQK